MVGGGGTPHCCKGGGLGVGQHLTAVKEEVGGGATPHCCKGGGLGGGGGGGQHLTAVKEEGLG